MNSLRLSERKAELIFLLTVIAFIFYFFADGILDLKWAAAFYHPENALEPWYEQHYFLWKLFYFAAPALTALFILPNLVVYVLSYVKPRFTKYRNSTLFVILIVLVGPGLLINSVFKPYWGRPRPREVVELGGYKHFQPFVERGAPRSGMSFPCGHCSVGFSTVALYFLLKRRRKKLAYLSLFGSSALGILMGVGRMADGAHFFSDVLWAGVMTYAPAYFLYYGLKLNEDQPVRVVNPKKALWISLSFTAALVIGVSLATPFKFKSERIFSADRFELSVSRGVVEVIIDPELKDQVKLEIDARGFGFPKSHLNITSSSPSSGRIGDSPTVLIITESGFFTDLESRYKILIPENLNSLKVRVEQRGAILKPKDLPSQFIFEEPKTP